MIGNDQYITTHYGTDGLFIPAIQDIYTLNGVNTIADYIRIVWDHIPSRYRPYLDNLNQPKRRELFDFMVCVGKVMLNDNINLNNIRAARFQRQKWTSQTLLFQQVLRDVFESDNIFVNNTQNDIQIRYLFNRTETAPTDEQIYLYDQTESTSGYYEPTYLYNRSEVSSAYNILITAPLVLQTQEQLMIDFCNLYILQQYTFKINFV